MDSVTLVASLVTKEEKKPTTFLSFSQQVREIGFAGRNEKSKEAQMLDIDPTSSLPAITLHSGRRGLMLSYCYPQPRRPPGQPCVTNSKLYSISRIVI